MATKNPDAVLERADALFATRDRLQRELQVIDAQITQCCRAYDDATGCRGVRPEALRRAANDRRTPKAA